MADSILERRDQINVIVTTYDLAAKKEDNKFMRRLRPDVCVYDEGMFHLTSFSWILAFATQRLETDQYQDTISRM